MGGRGSEAAAADHRDRVIITEARMPTRVASEREEPKRALANPSSVSVRTRAGF